MTYKEDLDAFYRSFATEDRPLTDKERWRSVGAIGYRESLGLTRDNDKANQRELRNYAAVRKEGSQPWGTRMHQSEEAKRESDITGVAFNAAKIEEHQARKMGEKGQVMLDALRSSSPDAVRPSSVIT